MPEIETIVRGRTYSFSLIQYDVYIKEGDAGNVRTDHTGWTVRSQVRTKVGNKVVANLNAFFPVPADGSVAIEHDRGFTTSLKASKQGDLWWDMVATDQDGQDHVLVFPEPFDIVTWPTFPGDDSSDDFIPGGGGHIYHTHPISQIVGLQAILDDLDAAIVTSYAGLSDATTANLPVLNVPLSNALAGKMDEATGIGGYIISGANVNITGAGTAVSPYVVNSAAGGADPDWGDIQGTLSDQTDLQAALNDRLQNISGLVTGGTGIATTGTGATGDPIVVNFTGLIQWTETLNTTSPNNVTNAIVFAATGGATSADAVIAAKGWGATLAQTPDGTSTGGNKRGQRATDLQKLRSNAAQVASGNDAVIPGGRDNTASGDQATVPGGLANVASGAQSIATGNDCQATGVSSYASGLGCRSSGAGGTALGNYASDRGLQGAVAHSAGRFTTTGDAQRGDYLLRIQTTNITTTELSMSGATPGAATRVVLPNNSTYKFRGTAVARSTATNDRKTWDFTGTITRGANAAATVIDAVSSEVDFESPAATGWGIDIDADTAAGSLRFRATGAAATTIRWLVEVKTTELAY